MSDPTKNPMLMLDEEKGLPGSGKDADVEAAQSWPLKVRIAGEETSVVPIPVTTERTQGF